MNTNNPLGSIVLISVPENLKIENTDLTIDQSILLPVEIPAGISPSEWKMQDLSWEMILSGMLKILAYDKSNENIGYYRNFVLSVKPQIVQELTQSAIVKAQVKDFDLGEEIFRALAGLEPENIRHRLNLTILYENKANYLKTLNRLEEYQKYMDIAEDSYRDMLEFGDTLADIFFNAAWFFYNKQDFMQTSELASSYLKFGDDEVKLAEAKRLLNDADRIKHQNDAYKEAHELILSDRNKEGLDKIETFLERNPDVWNAWFLKGWALRKLSDFTSAEQAFLKALELNKSQLDIYNELAICEIEMENYSAAEAHLLQAFEMDSENVKVISNMGILALKQGKKEDARGFFHTVLELEPEDPIALEYLNFLEKT